MRGRFITFEGGEGVGKSTQVRLLCAALAAAGIDALATREPGGAPGAEHIRALLIGGATDRWDALTEALLHMAARREHLVATVWPALEKGVWVVSDRFADSTLAYQGHAQGVGEEAVRALYRQVAGSFAPDLTVVLDLPVAEGLARARARDRGRGAGAGDRYERMGAAFHERLRAGFLEIARAEPGRCVVVDARGAEEATAREVRGIVGRRFGVRLP